MRCTREGEQNNLKLARLSCLQTLQTVEERILEDPFEAVQKKKRHSTEVEDNRSKLMMEMSALMCCRRLMPF